MKPDPITLDQRLDILDRDALLTLMRTLLKEEPGLVGRMEVLLASASPPGTSPKPRPPAINPAQFRREVEAILRPGRGRGYDDYGAASAIYDGIDGLLSRIQPLLDADDGDNALAALEPVMAVMVVEWLEYDDSDGDLGMTFDHLGEMLTEAILRADLADRATWRQRLEAWRNELADYGCEEKFELACRAVNEGWEEPTLRRILQGDDPGDLPTDPPLVDDALLRIRLQILESRGNHEAVLRLSRAVGAFDVHALALVRLGRMDEAEEMAMTSLRDPRHFHQLAQALQEQGDPHRAIRVAVGGLFRATTVPTTERYTLHPLAIWLRDVARRTGQRELALKAAGMAFTLSCELEDYAAAREIADNGWDAVRTELLARMAAADNPARPEQKVTLYLHEGMVDEAVGVIEDARFFHDPSLLRQTMAAAMASHPDWVIRRSRQEAEEIMNAGRANAYETATAWLHLTREAMVCTARQQEWNILLTTLIQTHHRKYKLRPLLEALNAPEPVRDKGANRS